MGSFRQDFAERRERFLSQRSMGDYSELPRFFRDSVEYQRDGCCSSLYRKFLKLLKNLGWVAVEALEMGMSDPRKIVFSAKMGLALILVSLLFLLNLPLKDLSRYSLWAILSVVVVFEFSIGATLSRGFSRGLGVLSAGGIALGMGELSRLVGNWGVVIAIIVIFITGLIFGSVFLSIICKHFFAFGFCFLFGILLNLMFLLFEGFFSTYAKLYPAMKPYENGFRVFLIMCCFMMVSGYGAVEFVKTAAAPFVLIALGAGVSLGVNICIYPTWAGQDLHNLVVQHFLSIATSLEGCVNSYLNCVEYERVPSQILTFQASDDPLYSGYRSAIESISREDTLITYAVWEPPHGPYKMFKYPWRNYVKVSGALRHCAIMVMALHGCILSEIQAPAEKRLVFRNELQRVGTESAKLLRLLGSKLKRMEKLDPGDLLYGVHEAAEELQMKVNRKSYLFVNSEGWEIGKPEDPKVVENFLDINDDDNYFEEYESINETATVIESVRFSRSLSDMDYNKHSINFSPPDRFPFEIMTEKHISRTFSGPMLEAVQHPKTREQWPESGEQWPEAYESLLYESASALSLATFSLLLIEFVARLQNLVDCFGELSEKAKFKDPTDLQEAAEEVGFCTRLHQLFTSMITNGN